MIIFILQPVHCPARIQPLKKNAGRYLDLKYSFTKSLPAIFSWVVKKPNIIYYKLLLFIIYFLLYLK